MSKSSLVDKTMLTSVNYDKGRSGKKIRKITIHHCAGVMSIEQIGNLFKQGSRQVSSHYGIGNDGRIGQYVDERNTAWTDGNWNSNCTSVTIETSNNKTGGQWTVSDKALKSLIKLVADIAKRNKLGKLVKGVNVTWHSMYASTACPGNYLRGKMDYIVNEANKILESEVPTGTYKTLQSVVLRAGPKSTYRAMKVKEMTIAGRKDATSKNPEADAVYKKGTLFTAREIYKNNQGSYWGRTPSGWVCIKTKTKKYCEKQ